jgi:NADH:ubiquinone oxidoreductase subunit 3 (subunit A)
MFVGATAFVLFAVFQQNLKLVQIIGGVLLFLLVIIVALQYIWAKNR